MMGSKKQKAEASTSLCAEEARLGLFVGRQQNGGTDNRSSDCTDPLNHKTVCVQRKRDAVQQATAATRAHILYQQLWPGCKGDSDPSPTQRREEFILLYLCFAPQER